MVAETPFTFIVIIPLLLLRLAELIKEEVEVTPFTLEVKVLIKLVN